MTDSYSKKESDYESSLHCCVTMKLVYKQVFSPQQQQHASRDVSTTTWYLNNHASITLETRSKLTRTTKQTNRYQNPQGGSYSCGFPIGDTGTWHRRGEIGKAWRHKKVTLQHNLGETIRIELQLATYRTGDRIQEEPALSICFSAKILATRACTRY